MFCALKHAPRDPVGTPDENILDSVRLARLERGLGRVRPNDGRERLAILPSDRNRNSQTSRYPPTLLARSRVRVKRPTPRSTSLAECHRAFNLGRPVDAAIRRAALEDLSWVAVWWRPPDQFGGSLSPAAFAPISSIETGRSLSGTSFRPVDWRWSTSCSACRPFHPCRPVPRIAP